MAYEIMAIDDQLMRIRIQGLMRLDDQRALERTACDLIEQGKKPRLLVILQNFEGWEKAEGWGDVSFLRDYGDNIAKIAIVGEERWKEQALVFTAKGLRTTQIEFFPPSSLREAESWLQT